MIFITILLVVAIVATVLLGFYACKTHSDNPIVGSIVTGIVTFTMAITLINGCVKAKVDKALIQSQLENPSQYTYTQLAEHNEKVTKLRVWQGTIFSFYNDVDLSNIDIDSVSQKVIVENKENN